MTGSKNGGGQRPRFILSANASPGQGGQGLNLQHMIECFEADFEQTVFAAGVGSVGANRPNVSVETVPPSRLAGHIWRVPLLRRRRDWMVWLGERNHDQQVARRLEQVPAAKYFQGASGQCLDSLKAARKKGSCTILDVVTLHNDVYGAAMIREGARFGLQSPQHPKLGRQILAEYGAADFLRVMSGPARTTFLERGFDPMRVFAAAPPVQLPELPATPYEPDPFIVCFVGLLDPAKGFHHLIEAFRALDRRDSELWLWGNTGNRAVANYLAEQMAGCPRIKLKPVSVREAGHAKVYGVSSVLVNASLADGFGYVVSEAMASGIPVITTSTTGASEWVEDGVSGFIVPPGDPAAIRQRLEILMNSPARRREMGQAAREAMGKLTLERMRQCYRRAVTGGNLQTA